MSARVAERTRTLLGEEIAVLRAAAGGDICDAWQVELVGGERLFVKSPRRPAPGMVSAEARGLAWLAEVGGLRIPAVRGFAEAEAGGPALLCLEWIEAGARGGPSFDEALGRGLAQLHRAACPGFGFEADNFIGSLPQRNSPAQRWSEFYLECRIRPQLERARKAGHFAGSHGRAYEAELHRLAEHLGPEEPPSRLHGDLWSGNCLADEAGAPVLVDPAVYGGHREVDLAMMRLFGGFSPRVFDAYAELHPPAPGHEERVPLYQLYPLLVHVNLFGGGYEASAREVFERYR